MRAFLPRTLMPLNLVKLLIGMLLLASLTGCFETRLDTEAICNGNPQLGCANLNMEDDQCRIERTNLVWHRYDMLQHPDDVKLIEEHNQLNKYFTCLNLAAQIRAIKVTKNTQARFDALMYSQSEQARIIEQMKTIDNPYIYYFLWSQGDEMAKRKFLQLEATNQLDTPELQYYLASYYANRDPIHTLDILSKALDLSDPAELDTRILQSLATTHQKAGHRELAYMWALIGREHGLPVAEDKELEIYYRFDEATKDYLQDKANTINQQLNDGSFTLSLVPTQAEILELNN